MSRRLVERVPFPLHAWRELLRPGDVALLAAALAAIVVLSPRLWNSDRPDRAVILHGGALFAEAPLAVRQRLDVPGPLGTTVIEIEPGRARVAADPDPRQYCVQQGWLTRSGAIAICAPNQVSLALRGRTTSHDSIGY